MEKSADTKKIIFLLPVWGGGGGEKVISDLSFNLPKSIEKIIVPFENKNYYPYDGRMIPLHLSLSTNPIFKLFIFINGYLRFKKVLVKEKPHYVISFGSLQNILNVLTSKRAIVRIDNPIAISHQKLWEKLYPLFVRFFFKRAYKIIVVSQGLKQELVERFKINPDNIDVIYNSIDIEKVKAMAQEKLEPMHEKVFKNPTIINIGSLIGQKGQAYLLCAFAKVKKELPDVQLVILGEGPLEHSLKKLAKNLGIEQNVHFLGWQKNPFKFLARSTVFALPSFWEGFGIVILEAMACGVPVVAYDCPFGPKEILAPELDISISVKKVHVASCGVLVPLPTGPSVARQEDYLAQALFMTISDKTLRQEIIKSCEKRVNYFNVENFLKGYTFLLE